MKAGAEFAAAMGVSRQGAQKQLNLACADQLVAIQDNPRNIRSPLYELTQAGKAAYEAAMALHVRWANALTRGVASSDLQTALNVLQDGRALRACRA